MDTKPLSLGEVNLMFQAYAAGTEGTCAVFIFREE